MYKKTAVLVFSILALALGGYYLGHTSHELSSSNTAHMLDSVDSLTFEQRNSEQERIILDVRTPEEYDSGHLTGARNIDFYNSDFAQTLSALDKSAPYSLYCRSGNRSGQTLDLMETLGFTNVIDLEGGIISWVESGKTL